MSSPALSQGPTPQWPNGESQDSMATSQGVTTEDGVSVRPMRLKVLYTFDDQNKTNCLARWPHVLQIQTVAMDETTSIGVIELKTCIQAIVQCSPELVARLGQDYTVYAYDFSEYDNPLVGQGMLSWALAASSPSPDAPAHQSNKPITGRVCKNILGLFANGVKETLEVKLRLVPVPSVLQSEFVNAMEKYRDLSRAMPPGLDPNEWMNLLQTNPNLGQLANKATPTPVANSVQGQSQNQKDGTSMEVVNQLLSPSLQQQSQADPLNQVNPTVAAREASVAETSASENPKKTSRPSSRASVKRPRKPRQPKAPKAAQLQGGNTSGYEEGTDGDDGPSGRKRAKTTKADWSSKSTIGDGPDSLRVTASTSGSLRMFRPIAINPALALAAPGIPRAPTPTPQNTKPLRARPKPISQTSMRQTSFSGEPEELQRHMSPYSASEKPQDRPRTSIESAQMSPERHESPADTPPGIGSSPPVMRTRPPSIMPSSPPCPSSPVLPQMPREGIDSGFMSGPLDDLFGEEEDVLPDFNDRVAEISPELPRHRVPQATFVIEEEMPGPMDLLPTKMPVIPPPKPLSKKALARAASRTGSRAGSVVSEDGQQTLPPLRRDSVAMPSQLSFPPHVAPTESATQQAPARPVSQPPAQSRAQSQRQSPSEQLRTQAPAVAPQAATQHPISEPSMVMAKASSSAQSTSAPRSRPESRVMSRTASMGSLTLPELPAGDPVLPPSALQRSQTWSEANQPSVDEAVPHQSNNNQVQPLQHYIDTYTALEFVGGETSAQDRARISKRASIAQKLELAIAKGKAPLFCNNCGVLDTPTWRKSWAQYYEGTPGYYEYSDAPGKVTCVVVLTRDEKTGQPTSYKTLKKTLLPSDKKQDYEEYNLCNPCGIWMTKYKSPRPPEKFDKYAPTTRKMPPARSRNVYPHGGFMTSDANIPPSDSFQPQSEAYFPPTGHYQRQASAPGPQEGVSHLDSTHTVQRQASENSLPQDDRGRSTSSRPPKRLKAMTSDAASAALRRAIQSSPARWQGTRNSPIDVEDDSMGSTRRLLFPSPRKDGSPNVLGEMVTNIVQVSADVQASKSLIMDAINKENCPPEVEVGDQDAELLRLFEEEMARPSTPTQNSPQVNPFKTPTRPTTTHRPITRSVSKSIGSAKSPGQLFPFGQQTPSKTPSSRRRSPRNQDASVFESPFTATLNQLISEVINNPSPARNLELDFANMPDLPSLNDNNMDVNFNVEDFFATVEPMPSSSPTMFSLYEDPLAMNNINWDDFGNFACENEKTGKETKVEIKTEPQDSPDKGDDNESQEQA
ncbi:hypothetical protein BJ875DRAFT_60162 [Amylocarpus encephaloides]|uniref:Ams2/SPT21 N-terminal domain-containing protein n=1 Tax=Amylocarpus encephaloides TaxID=45428 RepID=A0A9P8C404_9HELO|nr:hypothetical protein BJ875DRAFT_60162 [Amylocarpus encephaloides]